jgi:hypothetical protein
MAQVTRPNGLDFGGRIFFFAGAKGDPNTRVLENNDIGSAMPGSLYTRSDGDGTSTLYVCTGQTIDATSGKTVSVWTAKWFWLRPLFWPDLSAKNPALLRAAYPPSSSAE